MTLRVPGGKSKDGQVGADRGDVRTARTHIFPLMENAFPDRLQMRQDFA